MSAICSVESGPRVAMALLHSALWCTILLLMARRVSDRPLLVLNAGSSTLKFSLFDVSTAPAPHLQVHGAVEGIGVRPRFVVGDGAPHEADAADHTGAFAVVARWLDESLD